MDIFQAAYIYEIHFLRGHPVDKTWNWTQVFDVHGQKQGGIKTTDCNLDKGKPSAITLRLSLFKLNTENFQATVLSGSCLHWYSQYSISMAYFKVIFFNYAISV